MKYISKEQRVLKANNLNTSRQLLFCFAGEKHTDRYPSNRDSIGIEIVGQGATA